MSQGNINRLLELWALSLLKHGGAAPFDTYKHIYDRIDAIEEGKPFYFCDIWCLLLIWNWNWKGGAPWKCFKTSFSETVDDTEPNWKRQEYDVWYRDPEVVARNMLVNPDFDNEFDIAPFVELDKNGTRRRSDFMSGDFSWRQCVSSFIFL